MLFEHIAIKSALLLIYKAQRPPIEFATFKPPAMLLGTTDPPSVGLMLTAISGRDPH